MKRWGKIGLVTINILAGLYSMLQLLPFVLGDWEEDSPLYLTIGGLSILVAFILSVFIMIWVTVAHRSVCALRGIHPRLPSGLIGFFSGLPFFLFWLPLSYALEFLLVRSESADTPTMRWYSMFSKSRIANVFAIVMVINATALLVEILTEIFPTFLPNLPAEDHSLVGWTVYFTFLIGVLAGMKIVAKVNANIEHLAEEALKSWSP